MPFQYLLRLVVLAIGSPESTNRLGSNGWAMSVASRTNSRNPCRYMTRETRCFSREACGRTSRAIQPKRRQSSDTRKCRPSGRNDGLVCVVSPWASVVAVSGVPPEAATFSSPDRRSPSRFPGANTNRSIFAPRPAAKIRRVTDCDRRSTIYVDSLEFAVRTERDKPAVRRPEGTVTPFGSSQWAQPRWHRVIWNPECCLSGNVVDHERQRRFRPAKRSRRSDQSFQGLGKKAFSDRPAP